MDTQDRHAEWRHKYAALINMDIHHGHRHLAWTRTSRGKCFVKKKYRIFAKILPKDHNHKKRKSNFNFNSMRRP